MSSGTVPSGLAAPAALLSLPALVLTMVFFTYYLKWTPSDWIFKGLLHFSTNDPTSRTVVLQEPVPQSKKQAKKQEQNSKKNADLGGQTLMIVPLTSQLIANLSHTGEVDTLILLAMMLMVNGIVSFAVMHIFSLPDNKIWIAFALLLLGMAVSHLMQATVFYESVGRRDKVYMAAFGCLATLITSFGLTSDLGKRLLAFDITAASMEGAHRMQLIIDEIHSSSMEGTPPPKPVSPAIFHVAVTMMMIIMAAFLSGLLMLPGMKAARLIFQASSAHAWAERNCIAFKWYQMLLMRLVFILPGLTAMLWIVPMVEVLGIPLDLLVYIQPAAVLLTAIVLLAALRSLVQSHLNSGCMEWYRLKHEKLADDYKARLQGISGNVRWILQGTGRVGLELAAPAVLLLLLGLMLLTRSLPNTWAKDEIDRQPSALWRVLVGFPAWWLCLSWFSYSSMMTLFQRFGLVSSNRVYFE